MLQLVDGFFVRPLLLPRLTHLRFEIVDRISLFLDRPHPPLHELNLDGRLLDVLVLRLESPDKRLNLIVELHNPSLGFDVDRRPRLDLGNARDPRWGSSN